MQSQMCELGFPGWGSPRMEVKHRQLAQLTDGNLQPSECTHLPCLCILTNMDATATPEHSQCPLGLFSLLLLPASVHGLELGPHFFMLVLPGPSLHQALGKWYGLVRL